MHVIQTRNDPAAGRAAGVAIANGNPLMWLQNQILTWYWYMGRRRTGTARMPCRRQMSLAKEEALDLCQLTPRTGCAGLSDDNDADGFLH